MKTYCVDSLHDEKDELCACQQCIKTKGNQFTIGKLKDVFPWEGDKKPGVRHMNYELRKYGDGYCYQDANLKAW